MTWSRPDLYGTTRIAPRGRLWGSCPAGAQPTPLPPVSGQSAADKHKRDARSERAHCVRVALLYTALLLVGYRVGRGAGVPVGVTHGVTADVRCETIDFAAAPTRNLDVGSESPRFNGVCGGARSRVPFGKAISDPLSSQKVDVL